LKKIEALLPELSPNGNTQKKTHNIIVNL